MTVWGEVVTEWVFGSENCGRTSKHNEPAFVERLQVVDYIPNDRLLPDLFYGGLEIGQIDLVRVYRLIV